MATSGSFLWVTGPLTSDGVAVALATGAVAVALRHRRDPTTRRAVWAGALLGAALAVKALLIGAVVPVAWSLCTPAAGAHRVRRERAVSGVGRDGRIGDLAAAAGVCAAIGLMVSLPFGLGRVWDQSVRYHLDAAGTRTPGANLADVAATLGDRDLPLVAAGVVVAGVPVTAALGRRRPRARRTTGDVTDETLGRVGPAARSDVGPVLGWIGATVLVLALEHPLWRSHVAHLVVPVALLVALRPPPSRWLAVAAALTLPYHVVHLRPVLWPRPYDPTAARAVADVRLLPRGAWAISDEPGLVWRAGRRTPADFVDTSRLRIDERRITTGSLARAAAGDHVCGVLVWSQRFAALPGLPAALTGYTVARQYDPLRVLYVRQSCQLP